jgi:hypothetical protein
VNDCCCHQRAGYWQAVHMPPPPAAAQQWIGEVAAARLNEAVKAGGRDRLGRDQLASHHLGALGEWQAAAVLGIEWPAHVNTYKRLPDLPPDIEVRTARKPLLKVNVTEPDDPAMAARRYLLVVAGPDLSVVLLGWCYGHEAAGGPQADPGGIGRPAYFLPADGLHLLPLNARHQAVANRV